MSERANDQLADLIGSECNGHMQAGIASVTPDLRHIRLSPEDWPLRIFFAPWSDCSATVAALLVKVYWGARRGARDPGGTRHGGRATEAQGETAQPHHHR